MRTGFCQCVFCGRWFRRFTCNYNAEEENVVLILVLLEKGTPSARAVRFATRTTRKSKRNLRLARAQKPAKSRSRFLTINKENDHILIFLNIRFQRTLPLSLQVLNLSKESQTTEALPTMWSSGTKPQKRESALL